MVVGVEGEDADSSTMTKRKRKGEGKQRLSKSCPMDFCFDCRMRVLSAGPAGERTFIAWP